MKVPSRLPFFPTPPEQAAKPPLSCCGCREPTVPKEGELGAWDGGLNPHVVINGMGLDRLTGGFLHGPQFPHQWGTCASPVTAPGCLPSYPISLQRHPCIMQQRQTKLWGAKGDGCSPAAVRSCLSFPAGGHLSRLCLSAELFNPLNLQPNHKGSFSRLCERTCLPQTQLGFGGQEMQAAWEPDVGQGDSGRTSSFKQGARRAFALGAGC